MTATDRRTVAKLEASFERVQVLIEGELDQPRINSAYADLRSAWRLSVGLVDVDAPLTTEQPVWKLEQLMAAGATQS